MMSIVQVVILCVVLTWVSGAPAESPTDPLNPDVREKRGGEYDDDYYQSDANSFLQFLIDEYNKLSYFNSLCEAELNLLKQGSGSGGVRRDVIDSLQDIYRHIRELGRRDAKRDMDPWGYIYHYYYEVANMLLNWQRCDLELTELRSQQQGQTTPDTANQQGETTPDTANQQGEVTTEAATTCSICGEDFTQLPVE